MSKENLCRVFILDADWDRAVAALPAKDECFSSEDFANRAYARCFQANKDHNDGKYDDVITDASKALIKDDQNNCALCIRAYGYYLNNNYEAAIKDCETIVTNPDIEKKRTDTCDKARDAEDAAKANASNQDTQKQAADTARDEAKTAQETYCKAFRSAAFAYELLGLIYTSMGLHLEASRNYKLALLARQTDIKSASPLLMDAYRNARTRVKSV
jgi:hypothetical protein